MKFSELTDGLMGERIDDRPSGTDPEVTALCYDSRKVVPGAVFVAIEGFSVDGHRFVGDAVARGAVAVVCSRTVAVDAVTLRVDDAREALARLACRFYAYPAHQLTLVGVTGTSGKTTVTYLVERILETAGVAVGVIGTINYRYAGKVFANPVTTPESADLQAIFRQMVDHGITHAVMEVSSHALDLSRVAGCVFDVAVFTNLSHDHLDYHETMQNYWQSKQKLFECHLKPSDDRHAVRVVVNGDDAHGRELADRFGSTAYRTAARGTGDIRPEKISMDLAGIRGRVATPAGTLDIDSPLVGDFNLENILSATGVALALGLAPVVIADGIRAGTCVPGRLERIREGGERFIFVDYSHKPDALENAITTLRRLTPGRLITVFGCGGDRDRTKRPVMGEIAARHSDLSVITSDNPRSEDPLGIIEAIEAGVRRVCRRRWNAGDLGASWTGPAYLVEPDRRAAIVLAIDAAQPHDTVLIAGKGHETYQILAGETIHFDDREVAREVLAAQVRKGA